MEDTLSNRIKLLAKKSRYCRGVMKSPELEIDLSLENGEIRDFKVNCPNETFQRAIYEGLCEILAGKSFWSLALISPRELKNYLQDSNDKPPFPEELNDDFQHFFLSFELSLKKSILSKILDIWQNQQDLNSRPMGLKEQIELILSFFKVGIIPVFGNSSPIIAPYNWDSPVLSLLVFPKNHEATKFLLSILEEAYLLCLQITPLKLVAVEEKSI